ncbi:kinase-like domain-containing protein [Astrocystis sublimbata]|nr:kinase-like domain-containing protein [Astrocystis sublimbata]
MASSSESEQGRSSGDNQGKGKSKASRAEDAVPGASSVTCVKNEPEHDTFPISQCVYSWDQLVGITSSLADSPFRVMILPMVKGIDISAYGSARRFAIDEDWVNIEDIEAEPDEDALVKLFALVATKDNVGCSVAHRDTCFTLYFNIEHADDPLILSNRSQHNLYVARVRGENIIEKASEVEKRAVFELSLGEWAISTDDETLVEVKVLEREHWPITRSLSTKRPLEAAEARSRKTRVPPHLGGVTEEILERVPTGNDLLALRRGEVLRIGAGERHSELKQLAIISDHERTRVSRLEVLGQPGSSIAVKIMKTVNLGERATVRAAEAWVRETRIRCLFGHHFAIPRYFGADARFHGIYSEYIEGKPLMDYRDDGLRFQGNFIRSWRILSDMAGALSFIHEHNVVHADVSPINIVFDPFRGAVLVGFSRSYRVGDKLRSFGAPWYLPPEFLSSSDSHGKASDIWALGVIMQWVLGQIPMPEFEKKWDVADLHPSGMPKAHNEEARSRMSQWLGLVLRSKAPLIRNLDKIYGVVNGLLEELPDYRTDAATLKEHIVESYV